MKGMFREKGERGEGGKGGKGGRGEKGLKSGKILPVFKNPAGYVLSYLSIARFSSSAMRAACSSAIF